MNKFLKNLKKTISYYFFWALASVVIVTFEFMILTSVKENEKIDILIDAYNIDNDILNNLIDDNKPEYLKEINYRFNTSDNDMLVSVVTTYGEVEADLYILSTDALAKIDAPSYFYKLDTNLCASLFNNNLEYYYDENNNPYGIKINCSFIKDEDRTFYVLFANDSLHLGKLTNSEYDGAITFAKLLIGN